MTDTPRGGQGSHDPETFGEAFDRICRESTTTVEQGRRFERLFVQLVRAEPEFDVQDVWTWQEWPERRQLTGRAGQDLGIDLVARLNDGSLVAIQCKCYCDPRHKVSKPEIDSFLAESSRPAFDLRWVVATSDWNKNADDAIRGVEPSVRRIDFRNYSDRRYSVSTPGATPRAVREPYLLQDVAIDDVVDGLIMQSHDRGYLQMACGTGKTFVSLRVAERIVPDDGVILFAAPSISLVSQARREWLEHTQRTMSSLVVCSDKTAGGSRSEFGPDDLICPVESEPAKIAAHLRDRPGVKVIFCTYHSLRQVVEAQADYRAPAFDLAIADEAHRTTGIDDSQKRVNFQLFHRADDLIASKRLYMTATPRVYTESSVARHREKGLDVKGMDDVDTYGPPLHHLKFKDAVAAGMLSDYRVILFGVREEDISDELRQRVDQALEDETVSVEYSDAARLMGTYLAMNGYVSGKKSETPRRLQRTIAYASNIRRSEWFADTMGDEDLQEQFLMWSGNDIDPDKPPMHLEAQHLDASDNAMVRSHWLRRLNQTHENEDALLLSNVRIFSEGVDVPALDAVAFLDPRGSQIDIVQAVGRVMRKAEGKRFGYIVVPVYMPEGVENVADTLALREDAYRSIGLVLRSLLSHDERLAESIADFLQVSEPEPVDPIDDDDATIGEEDEEDAREKAVQARLEQGEEGVYAHVASASGLGMSGHATAITIEDSVRRAARYMADSPAITEAVRQVFEMPGADDREASTVAALMLFNACLMHKRLKEDAEGMDHLRGMDDIARSREPATLLREPWQNILKQDFEPIFRPALSLLEAIPDEESRFVDRAVVTLATCAINLNESDSDLGYDHAGPLYHRILGSARSDGAFYTHHVSALMLAGMALSDDLVDWTDREAIKNLKVLDPACGTGTLLMAALHTIKQKAVEHGAFKKDELPELHRHLVQHSIRGLDINYQATQLAAANLTLGAPSVDYEQMHIHTMQHGPTPEGDVKLGSLELLVDAVRGEQPGLFDNVKHAPIKGATNVERGEEPDIRDVDVVLMNPPFTNNSLRGTKYSRETLDLLQQRENLLKANVASISPLAGASIDSTSGSTFFAPLAEALVRDDRGVFGVVVPTTFCVSETVIDQRRFLAERFHIESVVTSHQPDHVNFSHDTGINESLLICRRQTPDHAEQPTKFISLKRMPSNGPEASAWLDSIAETESVSHRINEWPAKRVRDGNWAPAIYLDGSMPDRISEVSRNSHMSPAAQLLRLSGGRSVRGALRPPENGGGRSETSFPAIWNHKTGDRRTMFASPELRAEPKPGKLRTAERLFARHASRLLIAQRIDCKGVRTPAVLLDEPVLGNAFAMAHPIGQFPEPEQILKSWCLFLNSTVGAMLLLSVRARMLTYAQIPADQFKQLPLPDPSQCDVVPLAHAFDQLCHRELLPWCEMHIDPVRHQIDDAVCEVLSLDPDEVANWRRRIVAEPTVSNQPAP